MSHRRHCLGDETRKRVKALLKTRISAQRWPLVPFHIPMDDEMSKNHHDVADIAFSMGMHSHVVDAEGYPSIMVFWRKEFDSQAAMHRLGQPLPPLWSDGRSHEEKWDMWGNPVWRAQVAAVTAAEEEVKP
jgi:hypothetical protein